MKNHLKAASLALAIGALGATAAMAGKTTTPNPSAPPVVTTTLIATTFTFPPGGWIEGLLSRY